MVRLHIGLFIAMAAAAPALAKPIAFADGAAYYRPY
jgi:hypothetical protein